MSNYPSVRPPFASSPDSRSLAVHPEHNQQSFFQKVLTPAGCQWSVSFCNFPFPRSLFQSQRWHTVQWAPRVKWAGYFKSRILYIYLLGLSWYALKRRIFKVIGCTENNGLVKQMIMEVRRNWQYGGSLHPTLMVPHKAMFLNPVPTDTITAHILDDSLIWPISGLNEWIGVHFIRKRCCFPNKMVLFRCASKNRLIYMKN